VEHPKFGFGNGFKKLKPKDLTGKQALEVWKFLVKKTIIT